VKQNNKASQEWIKREFETHTPEESVLHVIPILKSATLTSDLFEAIAGLSVIAGLNGDKSGCNACSDTLIVLANARTSIEDVQYILAK
jgi:hypothetical protein